MTSSNLFGFKWHYVSFWWLIIYLLIAYAMNQFVLTDSVYYSSFADKLTSERLDSFIKTAKKFQWVSYAVLPVSLLLKWLTVAGIIFAGALFFGENVSFEKCFRIVILAELAFILAETIRLAYFLLHAPDTLFNFQNFYPLSVEQLLGVKSVPPFAVYPLQQLNFFELLYWLLLALGMSTFTKTTFGHSLKIVAVSYGFALLLLVLVIMFIQVQFAA
jgi:hypothetical protein